MTSSTATSNPVPTAAPSSGSGVTAGTAVVTGASGWLGQNLVRHLVPDRERVRCLVPDEDGAGRLGVLSPTVETVVGDVRDPGVVDRLFADVGNAAVFHAAAVIHPTRSTREFFDVNVGGTQMVLDRARRAGATRVVHVSSNSPFGANPTTADRFTEDSPYNPYMGYGASKREAEELVRQANDRGDVPTVIIRAPWFYGPYQPSRQSQFFTAIRKGRFPLVGDGTQRRSMVYTDNLVQGLLQAERTDKAVGQAYWIADAEPYALADILATVRRALAAEGVDVADRKPPTLPRAASVLAEKVDGVLQGRGRYLQAVHVFGEMKDTIACDIGRARDELGYEPAVGLYEGMRASIRWCLERGERI
jgi:nucleoside-diphosphate-sugar epimerase